MFVCVLFFRNWNTVVDMLISLTKKVDDTKTKIKSITKKVDDTRTELKSITKKVDDTSAELKTMKDIELKSMTKKVDNTKTELKTMKDTELKSITWTINSEIARHSCNSLQVDDRMEREYGKRKTLLFGVSFFAFFFLFAMLCVCVCGWVCICFFFLIWEGGTLSFFVLILTKKKKNYVVPGVATLIVGLIMLSNSASIDLSPQWERGLFFGYLISMLFYLIVNFGAPWIVCISSNIHCSSRPY